MINCLSNPQPFFPEGTALSECAQLGMTPGEEGPGGHGGQENLAEVLAVPSPSSEATVCLKQSIARR